ncbi:MAG TPA: hypothetical protein VFQ62_20740 [Methylomirabilota bacterium]|nr:hypothetical protein [Methylomirabilota bacterium]
MTQAELLRYLVESLDSLGIDYMIVGSHASIYYGEPRFTQDVDIVVELTPAALRGLLARFPESEFYVSEDAAREAVAQSGQFNIIHGASGVKIDVFVGKDTEYDRLRFGRRQRLPLVPGRDAFFARPEDVILYKLLYFREGGSDRHLRDIAGMLAVSGSELDMEYLADWARRLAVSDLWEATRGRAS